MRHDNDNCDLTIQAVAMCRFVDVAQSDGITTPTFHKSIEVVICHLVQ